MKNTLIFLLLFCSLSAFAGEQQYERLKPEVQTLMAMNVSDFPLYNAGFNNIEEETEWMVKMDSVLSKYMKDDKDRFNLLKAVHYESLRAKIDPEIVLGLIMVESGFKKYAFSSSGARGYMQVMPFWKDLIGNNKHDLFYMRTNLRYGCTILRHYLDLENNNMANALARYNGSIGKIEYPRAVLTAAKRFKYE
jgi:hypothetical protein